MIYNDGIFPCKVEYPATGVTAIIQGKAELDRLKPGWIIIQANVKQQTSVEGTEDGGLRSDTSETTSGEEPAKPAVSTADYDADAARAVAAGAGSSN